MGSPASRRGEKSGGALASSLSPFTLTFPRRYPYLFLASPWGEERALSPAGRPVGGGLPLPHFYGVTYLVIGYLGSWDFLTYVHVLSLFRFLVVFVSRCCIFLVVLLYFWISLGDISGFIVVLYFSLVVDYLASVLSCCSDFIRRADVARVEHPFTSLSSHFRAIIPSCFFPPSSEIVLLLRLGLARKVHLWQGKKEKKVKKRKKGKL